MSLPRHGRKRRGRWGTQGMGWGPMGGAGGEAAGAAGDAFWPSVGFAFYGISGSDDWNGTTLPLLAEVAALPITVSACENADKSGIVWPTTINAQGASPRRSFRGSLDATDGDVTTPVSASTVVNGSTLTYADGDWLSIGATGNFNFDGSGGGALKTQGEFWLRTAGVFSVVATCPHLDVLPEAAVWTVSDHIGDAVINGGGSYLGHALHFAGWWHKGGAFWVIHTLWNLTTEASIKAFIASYLHWNFSAIKAHFEAIGRPLAQLDGINEPFDEDIATVSAVKEPGLRGWNRVFPVYSAEESCWHYAFSLLTSIGANNQDRIRRGCQYTFQVAKMYGFDVGFNDFGWEGRRYTTNSLQVSTPDVNGNTANKTVWLGHQQGEKAIAIEYHLWKMLTDTQTPIVFDAGLDSGAVWVPPAIMGCQFHLEPKNQVHLPSLAAIFNRLSYQNIELCFTEINHRGEHQVTNQTAGIITITTGAGGDTITSVKACFPTLQTTTGDELIAAPVAWNTSNDQTAIDLAAAINAGTGTHLYTAVASTNTVRLRRDSSPRGFDLTAAKTGAVTVTPSNSRVNEPTNCSPQFRSHYKTVLLTSQNTRWTFGWDDANTDFWTYGSWIVESFLRMALTESQQLRLMKWWTPDGGSGGNPISLWEYDYSKSESYSAMQRVMASADWKQPSDRTIKNHGRIDFTWYKHLILTQSNVTVDVNGAGTSIDSTTGENSCPWTWWTSQGIEPDNFIGILSFTAPGAFPASGTRAFASYIDANNLVELNFSNATGTIVLRSFIGGVLEYEASLGVINLSADNVILMKVTPTGCKGCLNAGSVISGSGGAAAATAMNFGFSSAGGSGFSGASYLMYDMYATSEIADADIQARCVVPSRTNPWPLWSGGTYPALMTVDS